MRGIVTKGKSLVLTVWFMSLISTNAQPKMWQVALIGILLYETILMTIRTYRKATRKNKYNKSITAGHRDMERVAGERFGWPMKEVS